MLKVKFDEAAFDREVRRVADQIGQGTQRAASQAAMVGQMKARAYLLAFIYNNPPSKHYQRTETALRSLGMSLTPTGGGFLLTLRNDAPWAAQLEQGNELNYFEQETSDSHIPQISGEELALLLDSMAEMNDGDPAPTTLFSRRGPVDYQEPAAHITPAAVAAMYDFMKRLDQLWRTAR